MENDDIHSTTTKVIKSKILGKYFSLRGIKNLKNGISINHAYKAPMILSYIFKAEDCSPNAAACTNCISSFANTTFSAGTFQRRY